MEQLHSLSALDDEGLLTRLGRRVRILNATLFTLFYHLLLYLIDGGIPLRATAGKDVDSICTFSLQ